MGLGLSEGGDSTPFVKYDAKSGRWFCRFEVGKDFEGNPQWEDRMVPDANVVFVANLDAIEIGWIHFQSGQGPETALAPVSAGKTPSPNKNYKSGFRLMTFSDANFGGLREWMANSAAANGAMNDLYDLFEQQKGANPGKAPVVKFVRAEPVGKGEKQNYRPVFDIVQWTARPAEFDGAEANPPAQSQQAQATVANDPPPPPPQQPEQAAEGVNF